MNIALLRALVRLGGGGFLPETIAYKTRVEADGGLVINIRYVDFIFRKIKELDISTSGIVGFSALGGIKLSGYRVVKRYNLFGTIDEIPFGSDNQYAFGYYSGRYLKSNNNYPLVNTRPIIPAITLPTYIDAFITGYFRDAFSLSQGAIADDKCFLFFGSNNPSWYVQRGGSSVYNYADGVADWGKNTLITSRFIYNATNRKYYKNGVEQSNGTLHGGLRANSDNTADVALFRWANARYGSGLHKDLFIFSQLDKSKSDAFESFLMSKNTATLCNILIDGDSQSVAYNGASLSYGEALDTNLSTNGKDALITNAAVAGQTSAQLLSNYQTHVDDYYNAGISDNVAVILIGVNDPGYGVTVPQIQTNINNAVAISNAKGFRTFVCTQRACNVTYSTIQALNTSIRNNAASNNYTVIDIANDSRWNFDGAQNNTDYYMADKIHLTDLSHQIFGELIYNAVK